MIFRPLEPADYQLLAPIFRRQHNRLSVYALGSLMAWRDVGDFRAHVAIEDGLVYLLARNERDPGESYLTLPVPGLEVPPGRLLELAAGLGVPCVSYVSEDYLERHGRAAIARCFEITDEPMFEDYLFRTEDLAHLKGNRYARKRNHIHQFERAYVETGRAAIEPLTPAGAGDCLEFLEAWCKERDCDGVDKPLLLCEKHASTNALRELQLYESDGLVARIDGQVCGYALRFHLTDEMGSLSFEKAFASHPGLYQFLDRECARRLFLGRYAWINKESDMGEPGLAHAKQSYYPAARVKCYSLILSGETRHHNTITCQK